MMSTIEQRRGSAERTLRSEYVNREAALLPSSFKLMQAEGFDIERSITNVLHAAWYHKRRQPAIGLTGWKLAKRVQTLSRSCRSRIISLGFDDDVSSCPVYIHKLSALLLRELSLASSAFACKTFSKV